MKVRHKLGLLLIRMDQTRFPLCGAVESLAALSRNTGHSPLLPGTWPGRTAGYLQQTCGTPLRQSRDSEGGCDASGKRRHSLLQAGAFSPRCAAERRAVDLAATRYRRGGRWVAGRGTGSRRGVSWHSVCAAAQPRRLSCPQHRAPHKQWGVCRVPRCRPPPVASPPRNQSAHL